MKIAVSGASGYIGRELIKQSAQRGFELVAFGRAKIEGENLQSVIVDLVKTKPAVTELEGCDVLVHLAAIMRGKREQQIHDTLSLTQNILAAAYNAGIRHYVLVSSMSVLDYAKPNSTIDNHSPLLKDDIMNGNYCSTKLHQENYYLEWLAKHKCSAIILRPGLVYDDMQLSDAHAGFLKSGLGFYVKHKGVVPLVKKELTAKAILAACENASDENQYQLNLTDKECPSQADYINMLKNNGTIRFAIGISSLVYGTISAFVQFIFKCIGKQQRTPDTFRSASVNARYSPHRFETEATHNFLKL